MTAPVPDAPTDTPAAGRGAPSTDQQHAQHRRVKPKLRGWLHLGHVPGRRSIAGLVLTALADSTRGRIACGIFALTACLLFGVSALYHRGNWGPRMDGVLRRLDHANIFLIIAGTYTPLTMLLLPGAKGQWLLWGIWARARWPASSSGSSGSAPRAGSTPPATSRWAGRPSSSCRTSCAPAASRSLVLVIVGGLLYSAGGVIYGIKRPNPSPRWFGFHEVFHSLTLAAFVVHYVGISLVAYQHA